MAALHQEKDPFVTIVVPTRDRGGTIVRLIRTMLMNDDDNFEVIIVDQSEDDLTLAALEPFLEGSNVRYIRTATQGSAIGRNIGISEAKSEIIGLTDDDCEVPANWIRHLLAAFGLDSRIGIVFGNVLAGPHDQTAGFVPIYVRTEPYLARSIVEKHRVDGISACMGIRRSVWQALSGFDTMLGAGAPLRSAAEGDITIRALLSGFFVYETPHLTVVHHGFRSWDEGRALIYSYWYGTGAMLAKHVKCGHWAFGPLLLRLAWRWAFGKSLTAASLGDRPHKLFRLLAFVQGLAAGAITRVDRSRGQFISRQGCISDSRDYLECKR